MKLRDFRNLIVIVFVGIFTAKMMISIAPAFSFNFDSIMMNSVIMQLEVEHNEKDSGKSGAKLSETKLFCNTTYTFKALNKGYALNNSFIEHSKRYVNPFHPSVPTPPPNFS